MIPLRHRRTAWLFALLALSCVAVLSYVAGKRYARAATAVRHTLAVRATIADALSLIKDAETGQRGFLLTNDAAFLAPYLSAEREVAERLATLADITRDDQEDLGGAERLRLLAARKLDELSHTIRLAREGRVDDALAVVRSGEGHRMMVEIRTEVDRMLAREQVALARREQEAARGKRGTEIILIIGLALTVLLVSGGLSMARRDVAEARLISRRLTESERTFRLLADNAGDLVRILDEEGRSIYVSPSSEALLGYSPEEMLALPAESLHHRDDLPLFMAQADDLMVSRQGKTGLTHRLRHKNGEYRWFESHIQPALHEPDGKPRIHLTSRDVTARKVAEDALRTQTGMLQSILANMGDGVVVLDRDRRFALINPVAREYMRQQPGDLASPTAWSTENATFLPDGKTPFPPDQGPLTRALRGEPCDNVEIVIHDLAGQARHMSINARPVYDGAHPAGCVAVYHDVTAQRRAEQALVESEQRWRMLSESSFEGVVITRAGTVLDANANLAAWLGRDLSELPGMDGFSLFAPEDQDHVRSQSKEATVYEARMLRKDGSTFPVEVRGRMTEFQGQSVRLAVVRDITDRRLRDAETMRDADKLRALSLRDELTHLYNRRGFLELARQQLIGITRGHRWAALFFADLDGMKAINDGFGHDSGDRAITSMAEILMGSFRGSDIIARLGGDEFAILASECDDNGVVAACARVQRAVDELNAHGAEPYRIAVSMGAAIFDPDDPVALEALMEAADDQMYQQKRTRGLTRPPTSSPNDPKRGVRVS